MPKRGRKFITEFLVPNLNDKTFGARLAWVDTYSSIFQMQWNHKAASAWTEDDCQVFVEWDKKRGHYRPLEKEYFTKSKQRFRAVLNKSILDNEITQLPSEDKNVKLYFLGSGDAIPDRKFYIVTDPVNNKKNVPSHLNVEPGLESSTYSLELDQFTNTNFNGNALRDHNYQNIEEQALISESDFNIDAFNNDLSLYALGSYEKNVSTGFNIEPPNDEAFWDSPILSPKIEYSIDGHISENVIQDNSLSISLKRELEYPDIRQGYSIKKNKILIYLKKS